MNGALLLLPVRAFMVKVKVILEIPRRPRGGADVSSTLPSASVQNGGWVVNATPRPLYPRERPGTHCIGGWVDPRAGLDGCGESHPPPGFDPQTVQSVASRYTD